MKKAGTDTLLRRFSAGRQRADTRNVATTLFTTAAAATGHVDRQRRQSAFF